MGLCGLFRLSAIRTRTVLPALFCIVFLSVPDVLDVVGRNMDYRVSKLAVYPAGFAKYYLYVDEPLVCDWSSISF